MTPRASALFESSYTRAAEYPCNLCEPNTYLTTLFAYQNRLQRASDELFIKEDDKVHVPFRDLLPTGQANGLSFKKQNIFSITALKQWIGDESTYDPLSHVRTGNLVTKPDPLARFIFLFAADSRSPLKLTKEMALQILSYHQVMPAFLEFFHLFGQQARAMDLRFSGFREETVLASPAAGLEMPDLGRSGKQFELCYNLKGVTEKSPGDWSVRHAALYHKFDVASGRSLWILIKGSLDLKDRIEPITRAQCKEQARHFGSIEARFESSLAIHLVLAHWSGESWRWYLRHLEDVIEEHTEFARFEDPEKSLDPKDGKFYKTRDLQNIQTYAERANEAVTILESNVEVLVALRQYYEELANNPKFPLSTSSQECVSRLSRQLKNIIYDLKMQSTRAKLLVREVQSRKDLILQHLQSQNARSMEDLTAASYEVTKVAQDDAVAIRIITVVTLFYLPATFVSSFFSTDVVKYQDPGGSPPNETTSFSKLALYRWLQVTLPLTTLTLIFSYCGYLWAKRSVRKRNKFEIIAVV